MRKLKKNDIMYIFSSLKDDAAKYVHNDPQIAFDRLEYACRTMYAFNYVYTDAELETFVKKISDNNLSKVYINDVFVNRYVFIDTEGHDNRGLTQQYLRAMMANQIEYLYITLSEDNTSLSITLNEIKNYGSKGHILDFAGKGLSLIEKASCIHKAVVNFAPSKVFLHLQPWDVATLMAIHSVKGPIIYNINLTDHAFWLGSSFIDYNIEMRPYGFTVSVEKRGIPKEKELELPFFPITYKSGPAFQGFPDLPSNAIKIFTGGSPYKMKGENDFFFRKIIDGILDLSPNVYILLAGFRNNNAFEEKKALIKNKDRLVNIGLRRDINEVYRNIDIYLGTYPIMGGLMSQYAAIYGKPIICMSPEKAFEMSKVESFVNHFGNGVTTFRKLEDLLLYAERLINNHHFRAEESKKISNCIMTENRFFDIFKDLVNGHQNKFGFKTISLDYEGFSDIYLDVENQEHDLLKTIVQHYKLRSFTLFPKLKCLITNVLFQLMYDKLLLLRKRK